MKQSIFERYPKSTLLTIVTFLFIIALVLTEIFANKVLGLGKTVIYQSHPIYGYRPIPNQWVARNPTQIIKINNLGLRADQDWDPLDFHNKILFVGDSITYGGSYISNDELFSHLAAKPFSKYSSGNAGVNGWGVNNVHAFIKEMEFLPAQFYISVFPEGDFYRGLTRIGGQPFWTIKPKYALEEYFQYLIYKVHIKKTPVYTNAYSDSEKIKIANVAVRNLKDLDEYLNKNHRSLLIYISPTRSQLLGLESEDKILPPLFEKYHLKVIYLKDELKYLSSADVNKIYHDDIHLSVKGHQVWANTIRQDIHEMIQLHETQSHLVQKFDEHKNT